MRRSFFIVLIAVLGAAMVGAAAAAVVVADLRAEVARLQAQVETQDERLQRRVDAQDHRLSSFDTPTTAGIMSDDIDRLASDVQELTDSLELLAESDAATAGRLMRLERDVSEAAAPMAGATPGDLALVRSDLARVSSDLRRTRERVDYICLKFRDGPLGLGSFFC